ncbi:MAG TPA: hypothetical protein VGH49_02390, partial [Xanthobacteraceae bacterium]
GGRGGSTRWGGGARVDLTEGDQQPADIRLSGGRGERFMPSKEIFNFFRETYLLNIFNRLCERR